MPKRAQNSGPNTTPRDKPRERPEADLLPRLDRDLSAASDVSEDGGVSQHPIHDEDIEDREPQDYERDIDAATAYGDLVDILRRAK